ncbi:hypothetical protein [Nocardia sp. NPDC052566]|uniref:hypothetical protein n=1 Tax=Nocardia sp. NPDC052566 TaxID=3364330 RepID=UPI0037CAED7A
MFPCSNAACESSSHDAPNCPNLVVEPRQTRNLVILGLLALTIIAALVLAATAVGHR